MKSSFAARRKARVVGQDAPDEAGKDDNPGGDSSDEQGKTPIPVLHQTILTPHLLTDG